MTPKTTLGSAVLAMLLAVAAPAEDKKPDGATDDKAPRFDLSMADPQPIRANEVEAVSPVIRARNPEVPKGMDKRTAIMIGALWASTALDIHSSSRLDQTRYHEVNKLGGTGGQIATSALATGAAIIIHRYGNKRMRWLSSLLLNGATASHAYGAIHNYCLR